jgi:hypothetical protein
MRGWLRQLDRKAIRDELERQLARFREVMSVEPAYIDGHQHVHLLPHVREAVAEAAQQIGAYVRLTREAIDCTMFGRPAPRDSAYLSWTSRPLARLASRRGIRTNTGFRGARNFKERVPYRDLFRSMIAGAINGSIVMCHPGHVDETLQSRDPIRAQREEEFSYFAGDDFPRDLDAAGLQLTRLNEALA